MNRLSLCVIPSLGLALILSAMPLGMMAKMYLGNMIMGNILMFLGVLFLFPYWRITFSPHKNVPLARVLLFVLVCMIYYHFSSFNEPMHLLYNGIVVVVCIALMFHKYNKSIKIPYVVFFLWILSAICVVLGYNLIRTGIVGIYAENENFYDPDDTRIFDGLTMGSIIVTNMSCSFYYLLRDLNKKKAFFLYCWLSFCFFILALNQKRTPMIVAIVIFMLFVYEKGYYKTFVNKRFIMSTILFFAALMIIINIYLSEGIVWLMVQRVSQGIQDIIFGTGSLESTNSGSMRYFARQDAFQTLSEMEWYELLIGKGYMYSWYDIPLLQAFIDMGIYGVISFFSFIVYMPIKAFRYRNHPNVLFVIFLCMYGLLACLTSGHPYGPAKWVPICLLLFVLNGEGINVMNKNPFKKKGKYGPVNRIPIN